jgi:hypothetical protein
MTVIAFTFVAGLFIGVILGVFVAGLACAAGKNNHKDEV